MNRLLTWAALLGIKSLARKQININAGVSVIGGVGLGAGLGAGLMYFLDPDRGRRRRALLRDQLVAGVHKLGDAVDATSRDLSHRAHGVWAEGSHLVKHEKVSDEVLTARVRSRLGRAVSHPHAIQVIAEDGHVSLVGPVLASEVDDLLSCIKHVRGVTEVENRLTIYPQAEGISALQGGRQPAGHHFALMQTNWSPTTRLLTGIAGGALIGYCLKRRDLIGASLGTLGFGLMVRGLTNMEVKQWIGVGGEDSAIEIQKTINIQAPVEHVYEFWANFDNFPHFMSNVHEVTPVGDGRWQWVVAGPAGLPIKWTAEVTEQIPNQLIAWRTAPGSLIRHFGVIHFEPNAQGGTRVDIKLAYNPVAGAVGHVLAKLFGADPKCEMDGDLVRMKTMIETGHAPHDAAKPLHLVREAYVH